MADRSGDVARVLADIFGHSREDVEAEFGQEFYIDKQHLGTPVGRDRCRLLSKHILDVTDAYGKAVLDLGCGVGIYAIYMAALGAKEVVAVDHVVQDIEIARRIHSRLAPPLTGFSAEVLDVLRLPFPDASFDVVTCRDAISHIRDPRAALKEMYRVTREGGRLWLQDGNNALEVRSHRKRRLHWTRREYGPLPEVGQRSAESTCVCACVSNAREGASVEELRWGLEGRNLPYFAMRREMIRKRFPLLDGAALDLLAEETKGMWGQQLLEAVQAHLNGAAISTCSPYVCRNPATGEINEGEFNPFKLAQMLRELGFSSRVIRPYYAPRLAVRDGRPTMRGLAHYLGGHAIRALYPASVFLATTLEIRATKGHQGAR